MRSRPCVMLLRRHKLLQDVVIVICVLTHSHIILCLVTWLIFAFSTLLLSVEHQEEHPAHKNSCFKSCSDGSGWCIGRSTVWVWKSFVVEFKHVFGDFHRSQSVSFRYWRGDVAGGWEFPHSPRPQLRTAPRSRSDLVTFVFFTLKIIFSYDLHHSITTLSCTMLLSADI